jgi:hypothetical protein
VLFMTPTIAGNAFRKKVKLMRLCLPSIPIDAYLHSSKSIYLR